MVLVKKIVLDVLKPHQPSSIEFSQSIAKIGIDYKVHLIVIEMDESTETLQIMVEGGAINFDEIQSTINSMGGSIHSIDEVEVQSEVGDG